jgi:hypothetical protein
MKKSCVSAILLLLAFFGIHLPQAYPQISTEQFQQTEKYLRDHAQAPDEYLIAKFKDHSVILLGEEHAVKDNLDFVIALIPGLCKAGVYNIGMEFGASEDQARLDSLINAPQYDEQLARDLMFNYNAGWAYKEYTDIDRAAWSFNRTLPPKAKKFRIVNMSYKYNWSGFTPPRTPENMAQVFSKGTTDQYRADLIEKEIMKEKEKILILTGTPHAYTRYSNAPFEYNADNFCHYDTGWLGNRLYQKYPKPVFNILLHQPFYNSAGKKPLLLSPANGEIEKLMTRMNHVPLGFDLLNSPAGDLPDSSSLSFGHPGFTLGQYFDGYIFLKPFSQMQGCTFDTLFFKGKTWGDVKDQVPDRDWRNPSSLEEYIRQIKSFVDMPTRYSGLRRMS